MKNVLMFNLQKKDGEAVKVFLAQEGYQIFMEMELEAAIERLQRKDIQLVIMDVASTHKDSMESLKALRNAYRMPIIVLSSNDREQMKIAALNAGADDYIINPYHPLEFIARINSQYKRYIQLTRLYDNIDRIYKVDELVIDDGLRKVTVGEREVNLTPLEYKILRLLVQKRGQVFSNGEIYEAIWNMQAVGVENTIAVHIRHIREKIESNPGKPRYLKVVWGTGYKVG